MAFEKLMILESSWSNDDDYIIDSRSTKKIYDSIEALLSLHEEPVFIVERPLLRSRWIQDIDQFVSLSANKKGPNVIVLSGHGRHHLLQKDNRKMHRRTVSAIDGPINISVDIRQLSEKLRACIINKLLIFM